MQVKWPCVTTLYRNHKLSECTQ